MLPLFFAVCKKGGFLFLPENLPFRASKKRELLHSPFNQLFSGIKTGNH